MPVMSFVGTAYCGCVRSAIVDDAHSQDDAYVGKILVSWLRENLIIRRIASAEVRDMTWCCDKPWCPYKNKSGATDAT